MQAEDRGHDESEPCADSIEQIAEEQIHKIAKSRSKDNLVNSVLTLPHTPLNLQLQANALSPGSTFSNSSTVAVCLTLLGFAHSLLAAGRGAAVHGSGWFPHFW